jgi:hypothetical protein
MRTALVGPIAGTQRYQRPPRAMRCCSSSRRSRPERFRRAAVAASNQPSIRSLVRASSDEIAWSSCSSLSCCSRRRRAWAMRRSGVSSAAPGGGRVAKACSAEGTCAGGCPAARTEAPATVAAEPARRGWTLTLALMRPISSSRRRRGSCGAARPTQARRRSRHARRARPGARRRPSTGARRPRWPCPRRTARRVREVGDAQPQRAGQRGGRGPGRADGSKASGRRSS